jgi:hypothetical protein
LIEPKAILQFPSPLNLDCFLNSNCKYPELALFLVCFRTSNQSIFKKNFLLIILRPDKPILFYFRHITLIIRENWEAFVAENPALFNQIFKKCAKHVDKRLVYVTSDISHTERRSITGSDFSRDYAAVFSDMPLSDIQIEMEGKVLEAHKIVLWGKYVLIRITFTKLFL